MMGSHKAFQKDVEKTYIVAITKATKEKKWHLSGIYMWHIKEAA